MERKYLELVREGDWIIASTPEVDRMNDRVNQKGLSLDNFRKNPVLLYGHSHTDPWSLIGRVPEIEQTDAGLRIRVELREPASESDPMHIVKALWDSGLLRGASIGFQPLDARRNEKGGLNIEESELLEISLTPLPANQNALRIAVKAMDMAADEAPFDTLPQMEQEAGHIDIAPMANTASPYVAISTNAIGKFGSPSGTSITATTGGTWTIHAINTLADVGTKDAEAPADEAKQEVGAEPEQEQPAPVDDTAAEQAQAEAQAELRLAAILADFVNSIRPYLLQS